MRMRMQSSSDCAAKSKNIPRAIMTETVAYNVYSRDTQEKYFYSILKKAQEEYIKHMDYSPARNPPRNCAFSLATISMQFQIIRQQLQSRLCCQNMAKFLLLTRFWLRPLLFQSTSGVLLSSLCETTSICILGIAFSSLLSLKPVMIHSVPRESLASISTSLRQMSRLIRLAALRVVHRSVESGVRYQLKHCRAETVGANLSCLIVSTRKRRQRQFGLYPSLRGDLGPYLWRPTTVANGQPQWALSIHLRWCELLNVIEGASVLIIVVEAPLDL